MSETEKEQKPSEKKPSLLWPMLLWPLMGVPAYWATHAFLFWLLTKDPPTRDLGPSIFSALYALALSSILCFGIGAILGFRFARKTTDNRFPLATSTACGLGCAALCLVYNFGGCMLVGIGNGIRL